MPTIRCLTDAIFFGEGPRRHDGRLWFSDFYDHAVKSVDNDGLHLHTDLAGIAKYRASKAICRIAASGRCWARGCRTGGAELALMPTGDPCFACMLAGEDGRTLYMLTAPSSNAKVAALSPKGRVLAADVSAGSAGWP